tara:strand:+ start:11831 stop:14539 length:2709 start_codon:yes stop_codon:yes gene_type:complete
MPPYRGKTTTRGYSYLAGYRMIERDKELEAMKLAINEISSSQDQLKLYRMMIDDVNSQIARYEEMTNELLAREISAEAEMAAAGREGRKKTAQEILSAHIKLADIKIKQGATRIDAYKYADRDFDAPGKVDTIIAGSTRDRAPFISNANIARLPDHIDTFAGYDALYAGLSKQQKVDAAIKFRDQVISEGGGFLTGAIRDDISNKIAAKAGLTAADLNRGNWDVAKTQYAAQIMNEATGGTERLEAAMKKAETATPPEVKVAIDDVLKEAMSAVIADGSLEGDQAIFTALYKDLDLGNTDYAASTNFDDLFKTKLAADTRVQRARRLGSLQVRRESLQDQMMREIEPVTAEDIRLRQAEIYAGMRPAKRRVPPEMRARTQELASRAAAKRRRQLNVEGEKFIQGMPLAQQGAFRSILTAQQAYGGGEKQTASFQELIKSAPEAKDLIEDMLKLRGEGSIQGNELWERSHEKATELYAGVEDPIEKAQKIKDFTSGTSSQMYLNLWPEMMSMSQGSVDPDTSWKEHVDIGAEDIGAPGVPPPPEPTAREKRSKAARKRQRKERLQGLGEWLAGPQYDDEEVTTPTPQPEEAVLEDISEADLERERIDEDLPLAEVTPEPEPLPEPTPEPVPPVVAEEEEERRRWRPRDLFLERQERKDQETADNVFDDWYREIQDKASEGKFATLSDVDKAITEGMDIFDAEKISPDYQDKYAALSKNWSEDWKESEATLKRKPETYRGHPEILMKNVPEEQHALKEWNSLTEVVMMKNAAQRARWNADQRSDKQPFSFLADAELMDKALEYRKKHGGKPSADNPNPAWWVTLQGTAEPAKVEQYFKGFATIKGKKYPMVYDAKKNTITYKQTELDIGEAIKRTDLPAFRIFYQQNSKEIDAMNDAYDKSQGE